MRIRTLAHRTRTAAVTAAATAVVTAAIGAGAVTACAPSPPADPNSCGGQTIDRSAPVISAGDVVVAAPVAPIWAVHTDVAAYPTWKEGTTYSQRLDAGPIRVGSQFRWNNGPLPIVSTVRAVETDRCTLWGGPAAGIDGLHLWTFTPVPGGTLVHTEESWSGPPVERNPAAATAMLDQGLAQGRADLQRRMQSR